MGSIWFAIDDNFRARTKNVHSERERKRERERDQLVRLPNGDQVVMGSTPTFHIGI
mgnify:CR=1 FL=1